MHVVFVHQNFPAQLGHIASHLAQQVARQICNERSDVVFEVVGEDRIAYGGDARFTNGATFKEWVLKQDNDDLDRIRFLGRVQPTELA